MAFLTTNTLCIPVVGVSIPPRRSLVIARASTKSAKHQEPAAIAADGTYVSGRRQAVMFFGVASALVASTAISQSARAAGVLGGWSDIEDVTDPRVQELGKWAITEHNTQTRDNLEFVRVIGGKKQVVAGMNYILGIETKGPSGIYQASMYEAALFDTVSGERQLNCFLPMLA